VFIGLSAPGVSTLNASVMIAGLGSIFTGTYPYVTASNPSESLSADWVIWIVIALAFITMVTVGNIF
jgi:adenylosuccinate synthase